MSYTKKRHDRAIIRHNSQKHIQRKTYILKNIYDGGYPYNRAKSEPTYSAYYGFTEGARHRLSKGKIHCSCPMCREKTKEIGYPHSQKVRMAKGMEE